MIKRPGRSVGREAKAGGESRVKCRLGYTVDPTLSCLLTPNLT